LTDETGIDVSEVLGSKLDIGSSLNTTTSATQSSAEVLATTSIATASVATNASSATINALTAKSLLAGMTTSYSYMPVVAIQYASVLLQQGTGLPWWAVIGVTTLVSRIILLPLQISNQRITAKIPPAMAEWREQMMSKYGVPQPVTPEQKLWGHAQLVELYKKNGIKPMLLLINIAITLPAMMSLFFAWKEAIGLPGFDQGGALWFKNLSLPDNHLYGYAGLPGIASIVGFFGAMTMPTSKNASSQEVAVQKRMRNFIMVMTLLFPYLACDLPSGVFVFIIFQAFFIMMENILLRQKAIRLLLKLDR